jgi:hypothetical protein
MENVDNNKVTSVELEVTAGGIVKYAADDYIHLDICPYGVVYWRRNDTYRQIFPWHRVRLVTTVIGGTLGERAGFDMSDPEPKDYGTRDEDYFKREVKERPDSERLAQNMRDRRI